MRRAVGSVRARLLLVFSLLWGCAEPEAPSCCWDQVLMGAGFVCGLREDGAVECWGKERDDPGHGIDPDDPRYVDGDTLRLAALAPTITGTYGQLSRKAHGTACGTIEGGGAACALSFSHPLAEDPDNPADHPLQPELAGVQVTGAWACGLDADGSIVCWGQNYEGWREDAPWLAIGVDDFYDNLPTGQFDDLRFGTAMGCARRPDGTWTCWGWDDKSAFWLTGPGSTDAWRGKVIDFSNDNAACVVHSDGRPECWRSVTESIGGGQHPRDYDDVAAHLPESEGYNTVAVGADHACFLHETGALHCVGNDHKGQSSPPEGTFAKIFAGNYMSCAINEDGDLSCWGDGSSGALKVPAN